MRESYAVTSRSHVLNPIKPEVFPNIVAVSKPTAFRELRVALGVPSFDQLVQLIALFGSKDFSCRLCSPDECLQVASKINLQVPQCLP